MGFQESINSALGTASGIASKVAPDKVKSITGFKSRTADFRNFDEEAVNKSAESLKREIEGKKAQNLRVQNRMKKVREKHDPSKVITKDMNLD